MSRLIDADELMESVRKALGIKSMAKSLLLPAERTIIDQIDSAPTVNGWISVKDKLPERKWIDYLVATRIQNDGTRGFNVAWLNDDNGVWKSNDEWICDGREIVTHWMPLQEPPEEDATDGNH